MYKISISFPYTKICLKNTSHSYISRTEINYLAQIDGEYEVMMMFWGHQSKCLLYSNRKWSLPFRIKIKIREKYLCFEKKNNNLIALLFSAFTWESGSRFDITILHNSYTRAHLLQNAIAYIS